MLDRIERWRVPLLFGLGFVVTALIWILIERADNAARPLEFAATDAAPGGLRVEVTGAVRLPGVYSFEPGARVEEAIAAAGGPRDDADMRSLNQATRLHDEQRLYVPSRNDSPSVGAVPGGVIAEPAAQTELLDLNLATTSELEELPGIGAVRAQRIVDSRLGEGPFLSPEELVSRGIIPQSIYEGLRELVTVAAP